MPHGRGSLYPVGPSKAHIFVYIWNMQGLMVHQEFVDLVKSINAERPFQATYGVVTQGKNIEGTIDR